MRVPGRQKGDRRASEVDVAGDNVETGHIANSLRAVARHSHNRHREAPIGGCPDDHGVFPRYAGAWVGVCTGVEVGVYTQRDAGIADKAP